MKTRELIKRLKEADPTGELECCINKTVDIYMVDVLPAYYDGRQEILVRDPELNRFYDVVGGIVTGEGMKVCIISYSIKDAIWDNEGNFKIQYVACSQSDKEFYEKEKSEAVDLYGRTGRGDI
jgi:hypothetical protein